MKARIVEKDNDFVRAVALQTAIHIALKSDVNFHEAFGEVMKASADESKDEYTKFYNKTKEEFDEIRRMLQDKSDKKD